MRGRKPKPTQLKLLDGDRSDRINHSEPRPTSGLPRCPAHLPPAAKAKWRQLAKETTWLARPDGDLLALYCTAWARWLKAEAEIALTDVVFMAKGKNKGEEFFYQSPYLAVANKAMEQMHKLGACLGLNPVDRTRIKAPGVAADDDELDRFMAGERKQA